MFVYDAASDGVLVAAENGVEAELFPWIDIAKELGDIGGDMTDALAENGRLQRKRCCIMIDALGKDPLHGQLPTR
jgi:hypothetical protein